MQTLKLCVESPTFLPCDEETGMVITMMLQKLAMVRLLLFAALFLGFCCCTSFSVRCAHGRSRRFAASLSSGLLERTLLEPRIAKLEHENHELASTDKDFYHKEHGHHVSPLYRRSGYDEPEEEEEEEEERGRHRRRREHDHDYERYEPESFVLEKPIKLIKTEAGEMRVLPHGTNNELSRNRIGLGFLSLEPKALLLPQYIDADCLFLVHKGRGRLSWVEKGDLSEIDLEEGDVYKIESGTVFHVFNRDEGQRLHIFSIYDTATMFNDQIFHNFFVAGGQKPKTILSGFDEDVLATAFKVSADEVRDMLSSQTQGPIIYSVDKNESRRELSFGQSFTEMLNNYFRLPSIFPKDSSQKPYNILKKKPDFSNDYGSTAAIHGKDFKLLKDVDKGVFSVRLKAGAVLAPHWNPRAMEIALVTKGEGEIQIVYPNGSAAATESVREGSVFYIPQNFPMCQIASRSGPFEFMGFTSSARPNRPQFLAGSNSVLRKLDSEVLAASFNIPVDHLDRFFDAQTDAVILPGQAVEPEPEPERKGGREKVQRA